MPTLVISEALKGWDQAAERFTDISAGCYPAEFPVTRVRNWRNGRPFIQIDGTTLGIDTEALERQNNVAYVRP